MFCFISVHNQTILHFSERICLLVKSDIPIPCTRGKKNSQNQITKNQQINKQHHPKKNLEKSNAEYVVHSISFQTFLHSN